MDLPLVAVLPVRRRTHQGLRRMARHPGRSARTGLTLGGTETPAMASRPWTIAYQPSAHRRHRVHRHHVDRQPQGRAHQGPGGSLVVIAGYIICAVVVAPAPITLGVPECAAPMSVFYQAVPSAVSPPTTLPHFAASAMTGACAVCSAGRGSLGARGWSAPGCPAPGAVRPRCRLRVAVAAAQGRCDFGRMLAAPFGREAGMRGRAAPRRQWEWRGWAAGSVGAFRAATAKPRP